MRVVASCCGDLHCILHFAVTEVFQLVIRVCISFFHIISFDMIVLHCIECSHVYCNCIMSHFTVLSCIVFCTISYRIISCYDCAGSLCLIVSKCVSLHCTQMICTALPFVAPICCTGAFVVLRIQYVVFYCIALHLMLHCIVLFGIVLQERRCGRLVYLCR